MPNSTLDAAARKPHVRTALWVIGCAGAAILVIGAIVLTTTLYQLAEATRETQVAGVQRAERDRARDEATAQLAEDAARSADRIEDCTTPGRRCFEDQLKRTGDAVAGINQGTLAVIVAALSCQADGVTEEKPLARCTARRAAASTVKTQPQPQESRR